jgi:hypothetical protein
LKPSNIIIDREGEPIMIDFGAARDLRVTRAGGVSRIFTAEYAPYEQQTPGIEQSPASDLYALGAIFYKAITGDLPPHAVSRLSTDRYVRLAGNPDWPAYPPHLLRIIDQLLAVEMKDRPQSADEVLRAIEEATVFVPPRATPTRHAPVPDARTLIFGKEPPPLDLGRAARPRSDAPPPRPPARRRMALTVGLGAATVIAMGGLAVASLTVLPAGWWNPRGQSTTAATGGAAEGGKTEQASSNAGSALTAAAGSSARDTAAPTGASQPEPPLGASAPPPPKPAVASEPKAVKAEAPPLPPPLPPRPEPAPAKVVEPPFKAPVSPVVEKSAPAPARPAEPPPALASLIPEKAAPPPIRPPDPAPAFASPMPERPTPPRVQPPEPAPTWASPIPEKPAPTPVRPPDPTPTLASPMPEKPTPPRVQPPEPVPALASIIPDKPAPPPVRPPEPVQVKPNADIAASAFDVPLPTRKPSAPALAASESLPPMAALVPPAPPAKPAAPAPTRSAPPGSASGDEREAWLQAKYAVKEDELRAFLERYPNSEFAADAKARLATFSRAALSRYNGTWRSFGIAGCPFTGVMELNQGAFTLTLKQPTSSMSVSGEIDETGAIQKITSNPDNLTPTGKLSSMTVAPVGCRFEFALVDVNVPAMKTQ